MHTVSITLGKYNAQQVTATEDLAIPALDDVAPLRSNYARAHSAMMRAVQHRTGVLVVGPKGVGKTTAVDRALRQHRDEEQQLASALPGEYRERRVLHVHGLNSRTGRELLMSMLKVVSPGLRDRALGMRKTDDDLRAELVTALLNKSYALIVCDEAEYLSDRAIDQLRKIMADAAERDTRRVVVDAGQEAYRAAGIGVLLVGTAAVLDVVRRDPDAGHRWSEVVEMEDLAPDVLSACYLAVFPGFRAHVDDVGNAPWTAFCEQHVSVGRRRTVDSVVMHARRYYEEFLASELAGGRIVPRDHVTFHRQLFLYTLDSGVLTKAVSPRGKV